jgi:hypothetical protein
MNTGNDEGKNAFCLPIVNQNAIRYTGTYILKKNLYKENHNTLHEKTTTGIGGSSNRHVFSRSGSRMA